MLFKIRAMLYWAENMKYLRARKKHSQKHVADELGITRTRYSKYEYGLSEPPIELLVKIARYYEVNVDELLSEDMFRSANLRKEL